MTIALDLTNIQFLTAQINDLTREQTVLTTQEVRLINSQQSSSRALSRQKSLAQEQIVSQYATEYATGQNSNLLSYSQDDINNMTEDERAAYDDACEEAEENAKDAAESEIKRLDARFDALKEQYEAKAATEETILKQQITENKNNLAYSQAELSTLKSNLGTAIGKDFKCTVAGS